jgi:hypothetical protein
MLPSFIPTTVGIVVHLALTIWALYQYRQHWQKIRRTYNLYKQFKGQQTYLDWALSETKDTLSNCTVLAWISVCLAGVYAVYGSWMLIAAEIVFIATVAIGHAIQNRHNRHKTN